MLDIYADESCKDAHHYLVLGCTLVSSDQVPIVVDQVQQMRRTLNMTRELKWNKVSNAKLEEYKAFARVYFDLVRDKVIQFHCLVADAHTFDHRRFNGGSAEIGYNKLMYQLLVKAAVRRRDREPFYVYLDERTTQHGLGELQTILCRGYQKASGSRFREPFRRVHFRDSKICDVLQLNDIVIGAVGFIWNGHHLRVGASAAKCELARYVTELANVRSLDRGTPFARSDFRIWRFEFKSG